MQGATFPNKRCKQKLVLKDSYAPNEECMQRIKGTIEACNKGGPHASNERDMQEVKCAIEGDQKRGICLLNLRTSTKRLFALESKKALSLCLLAWCEPLTCKKESVD